jgi:hypothetical protein
MALLGSAAAVRADLDIRPYLSGGRIVTGGHDDALNVDVPQARACGYLFGEDPLSPLAMTDPGFNSGAGDLTPGAQLSFAVHGPLLYWDGTGAITFAAAPAGAALGLQKFSPPATILEAAMTGASGEQGGFAIGTVQVGGQIHQHLTSVLSMADSSLPPDGVYAFELSAILGANESTRSERFYLVYGNGVDEAVLDDAVGYLGAAAVPEPGCLGLAGLSGVMLLRRTRRRNLL